MPLSQAIIMIGAGSLVLLTSVFILTIVVCFIYIIWYAIREILCEVFCKCHSKSYASKQI